MLRLGVVGLEHYHVTGWVDSLAQFTDQVEIVGLYDPDPENGKRLVPRHSDPHLSQALPAHFKDLPFTTDLDSLVKDQKIDIALVTMPNFLAPAAITQLANAGIHMLVDKPGAKTAPEAEAAFGAAKANGVKVAVGLTKRYGQAWKDARQAVQNGRLGTLYSAEVVFVASSVLVRDPTNQIFNKQRSGGGILHWLGVHDIDILRWLTGDKVVELSAMSGITNGQDIDVEDTISISMRLESGALATVHYAYGLPRGGYDGYVALRGSGGSVKITPASEVTWIGPGNANDPITLEEKTYTAVKAPGYGTAGLSIINDLLGAIRDNRDPLVTGDDVIAALRVIDAAYEAAATGQRIRLT